MASIPLPALGIKPPEIANPLDTYGKMIQLKSLMQQQQYQQQAQPLELQQRQQENQARQLEIEQKQRDQATEQQLNDAYIKSNGDWGKAADLLTQNKGPAKAVMAAKNNDMQQKKSALELVKAQGEEALRQANLMQGAHDQLAALPPEQRATAYPQAVQGLKNAGIDVSKLSPEYPGDQAFAQFGPAVQGHTQYVEDALKKSEIDKNEREKSPPVDQQELQDYLAKHPGKGPADFMAYKAKLVPQFNFNLGQQAANSVQGDSLDLAAQDYLISGKLPPGGRGPSGIALQNKIRERAASLIPPGMNLATIRTAYAGDKASLGKLQTQTDSVEAFEATANKNLQLMTDLAKDIPDVGLKFANTPLRLISGGMIGTANMAKFTAARTTALTEIAKVLSSANASGGVVSDSARHEVEGLIGKDATYSSIIQAANVLKQDMENRRQSYHDQLNDIQTRTGNLVNSGKSNGQPSVGGQTQAPANQPAANDFFGQFGGKPRQ